MHGFLKRLRRAQGGGVAIEYAIILPTFITLIVGGLCLGNLAFAVNSLHFAVQDAARCAAVKTTICTGSATTITYAQSRYSGPRIAPDFTYSATGCGHTVGGSGSYPMMLGFYSFNVPISASACYP